MSVKFVHQNVVHVETIKNELQLQKERTKFSLKPFRKLHDSPETSIDNNPPEGVEDTEEEIEDEPVTETKRKYAVPRTESEEIGWITEPMIQDQMFNFRRVSTDITKHAEHAWKQQSKPF